jgi:REP element-mobilizing transposase RayT
MGQTLTSLVYHVVFSTKGRAPSIGDDLLTELPRYIASLVMELGGHAITVKATSDHVHLLIRLPPTVTLSDAMRVVKANSSRWAGRRTGAEFAWQAGYAAFSVSAAETEGVRAYIENQAAHHREIDGKAELRALLSAHGVEWDERYVWG